MKARAFISGGHVYCRVQRADMDIERCFSCSRLRVLADEASPPFVVCDTSGIVPDLADERLFTEWRRQHHARDQRT